MKAVLQNLMSVLGGEAAVRVANFAAVLLIARAYGEAVLGAYALSLAFVTVVIMFADGGLQTAAITQLSVASPDRNQIIGRLTVVKTVMLGISYLLLAFVATWASKDSVFWSIGLWVALRAVFQSYSQLQVAILKAVSRANWIVFIQSVHSCLVFLGIWIAFRLKWEASAFLGWLTFCQFVELALGVWVLHQNSIQPRWPAGVHFRATLQAAAPFGIAYGFANLIIRSDTIILSTLTSLTGVGVFSAANTMLLMVYLSGWLLTSILLPEMARIAERPASLTAYARRWARYVTMVSAPGAALISLVAPRGILLLYGTAYAASGLIGSAMALACPFILLNSIYAARAIAADRKSVFLGIYGAGILATLALDFTLGHRFGPLGIAVAIVIREAGTLLAFWFFLSRSAPFGPQVEVRAVSEVTRASFTDSMRSHDCP